MNIAIDTWFTEEEMYDLGLMEYADDADTRVIPTEYLPRIPPDELQFLMYEDSDHVPSGELKDSLVRLKNMGKTLSYFSKTYIKIPFHLYKKFPKEFNNLYKDSPEYFYNFPISFKGIPNYLSKIFSLSKHFTDLSDYYHTVSKSFDFLLKSRSENILNSVVKQKKFNIKNLINVKNLEKKTFIPLVRTYSYMKFLYLWNYLNDSSPVILKDSITTRLYQELAAPEIAQKDKIFKKISQFHTELTDWQLEILDNLKVYTLTSKKKPVKDKNLIPSLLKQSKLGYLKVELSKNFLKKILASNMMTWKRIRYNSSTAYQHFLTFFVENEQNLLDRFKTRLNTLESTKYQYLSSMNATKIKESSLFNTAVPKEPPKIKKYMNPLRITTEYEKYSYTFNKNETKTFLASNSKFSSPFTNSLINNVIKSSTALSRGSISFFPTAFTSKVSFYDMLIESILYKTYDRYENHSNLLLNEFSKILFYQLRLKKYIKELEMESLKNMIKTEYLYKYSVLPNIKNEYYRPNDFIVCFLNKNDALFSPKEKPFLHEKFNKTYQESVVEKNFGSLYRLYVENNKNIFKNQENQKSLLLIPSSKDLKNKEEKKFLQKFLEKQLTKKDKFLKGFSFSFVKIYLLDFNDQLPQIKFSRNKKNICFYPLRYGKTVNFYLPYSFDKTRILKDWKNEKNIFGKKNIFRKLIKKQNVNSYEIECIDGDFVNRKREIEFEPKVVEMDLSEFLKLTSGFSLKNQKIIPINY